MVPIFKKRSRNAFGNHRGISLIPVITEPLVSIMICRLQITGKTTTRDEQTGFPPGTGRTGRKGNRFTDVYEQQKLSSETSKAHLTPLMKICF